MGVLRLNLTAPVLGTIRIPGRETLAMPWRSAWFEGPFQVGQEGFQGHPPASFQ
jgi:hypothetical protein